MTVDVAYRAGGGRVAVGQFNSAFLSGPSITATPSLTDGAAFTLTGTRFSASGNHVFLNGREIGLASESTTSITTNALSVASLALPLTTPVEIWVVDASGNESEHLPVTISPASGQRAFAITATQLGDPTFRLETVPDLEI